VEDTGVGMSQEVIARAFEPFFSTKAEGRGTGLGLAFVYAAMRRIGGFVEVFSTINAGTTFTLWLPRARQLTMRPGPEPR
jgi:signal transduction histidine kinase